MTGISPPPTITDLVIVRIGACVLAGQVVLFLGAAGMWVPLSSVAVAG
eukprot:CAMPEP_0177685170 /NCGR_PEP_ID=MMETSP0447-20121125/32868_1 /TAXON_ID=0 /ORGANISM="Stygamoeba regulata, Strain BSH-02190019" /LENGTH=47 /DNA_ID= /DNA_START= /DNA_END= /DNA_ORIENTATION=